MCRTVPEFLEICNEEDTNILNRYQSNFEMYAFKLNSLLRSYNPIDGFINDIPNLDRLTSLYQTTEVIRLFRGTNDSNILPFINGNTYTNPEFLSTSTTREASHILFRNVEFQSPIAFLEITCPIGTAMAPFVNGMEYEMLLGRGHRFDFERRVSNSIDELERIMGRVYSRGINELIIYSMNLII